MQNSNLKVQLVHLDGPFKGEIQDYFGPVISIGRHPDCQLVFPKECAAISRKHAEIVREGNRFKFVDKSSNGTLINGKPQEEVFLKDGDVLIIGGDGGPKVSFLSSKLEKEDEDALAVAELVVEKQVPVVEPSPDIQSHPLPGIAPKVPFQPQAIPVEAVPSPVKPVPAVAKTFIVQYGATLTSFKQLPITIGSSGDCDCTLQHPALLAEHAQIFFRDNQYWVKDLTGRGLLTINQQPVQSEASLPPDSRLALTEKGPKFQFLGDGRLAEIEITEEEKPKPSSVSRQKRRETRGHQETASGRDKKKIWPLIVILAIGGVAVTCYFLQPSFFTDFL